jgi:hypothetical protein
MDGLKSGMRGGGVQKRIADQALTLACGVSDMKALSKWKLQQKRRREG